MNSFIILSGVVGFLALSAFSFSFSRKGETLIEYVGITARRIRNTSAIIAVVGLSIFYIFLRHSLRLSSDRDIGDDPCKRIPTGWSGKPVSLFEYWDPDFWTVHRADVRLAIGAFTYTQTDLCVDGPIPIILTRAYRSGARYSESFGSGFSSWFDVFIAGNTEPFSYMYLRMPDGNELYYRRITPGIGYSDAVYIHDPAPGAERDFLAYSRIVWDRDHWLLMARNGLEFEFPDSYKAKRQEQAAYVQIKDSGGNTLWIDRDASGNVLRVRSSSGAQLNLVHDSNNRVIRADGPDGVQISYQYDDRGRLISVTDATATTSYKYDDRDDLITVERPDGTIWVQNGYSDAGLIAREALSDRGETNFTYTVRNDGRITAADEVTSDGCRYSSTFNDLYVVTSTAHFFVRSGVPPEYCR